MARSLLHKNKLEEFKSWLSAEKIECREGKGDCQVLQVKIGNQWLCIYEKLEAKEHYTNDRRLNRLVARFCSETRSDTQKLTDDLMHVLFSHQRQSA